MEGIYIRGVGSYEGVYNLSAGKFMAHSSHRIDAFFGHLWVRVGENVDRLHHKFIEGVVGR
jgi:hypothetical protein